MSFLAGLHGICDGATRKCEWKRSDDAEGQDEQLASHKSSFFEGRTEAARAFERPGVEAEFRGPPSPRLAPQTNSTHLRPPDAADLGVRRLAPAIDAALVTASIAIALVLGAARSGAAPRSSAARPAREPSDCGRMGRRFPQAELTGAEFDPATPSRSHGQGLEGLPTVLNGVEQLIADPVCGAFARRQLLLIELTPFDDAGRSALEQVS
jgi:hypothetical protein